MQIEEGKYYKTRDGRKAGPAKLHSRQYNYWNLGEAFVAAHEGDGRYACGRESPDDLIAEWTDGPVVTETVTKTRIVPGVYGIVTVGSLDRRGVWVDVDGYRTADELDAAAAVLSALAKGLRDAN